MMASDEVFDFKDRKPLMDEVQLMMAEEGRELPIDHNALPDVMRETCKASKAAAPIWAVSNVYEWSLGEMTRKRSRGNLRTFQTAASPHCVS